MFHRLIPLRVSLMSLLVVACLAAITGHISNAQTAGAGSITGTVTDPQKSALPGASVTVTNTDNGIDHEFTTNSAGIYVAPFLQPGHYKVSATSAGFGRVEATGLTLRQAVLLGGAVTRRRGSG